MRGSAPSRSCSRPSTRSRQTKGNQDWSNMATTKGLRCSAHAGRDQRRSPASGNPAVLRTSISRPATVNSGEILASSRQTPSRSSSRATSSIRSMESIPSPASTGSSSSISLTGTPVTSARSCLIGVTVLGPVGMGAGCGCSDKLRNTISLRTLRVAERGKSGSGQTDQETMRW